MRTLWTRLAAASGAVAAGLIIAGLIVGDINSLVGVSESADAIARTFEQQRGELFLGAYLTMLGAFAFLWFLGFLRSYLTSTSGQKHWLFEVAFGGGLVSIAMILVSAHFTQAFTVFSDFQGETQAAKALYTLEWNEHLLVEAPPLAALIGATAIAGFVFQSFPRWINVLGVLATGLLLTPNVAVFGLFLGFFWLAVISIYLTLVAGRVTPREASGNGQRS